MNYVYYGMHADHKEVERETFDLLRKLSVEWVG